MSILFEISRLFFLTSYGIYAKNHKINYKTKLDDIYEYQVSKVDTKNSDILYLKHKIKLCILQNTYSNIHDLNLLTQKINRYNDKIIDQVVFGCLINCMTKK
jgi:hypothetical protein